MNSSKPQNFSVLICDQDQDSANQIADFLATNDGVDFSVRQASTIEAIEKALGSTPPEAVILALNLEGKGMMEWLDEIKTKNVAPAIVLAAHGDELIAVESMKRGAFDYIPKSVLSRDVVIQSLIYARDRFNHLNAIEDERLDLERMAMFDSLTELLSRRALMEQMEVEMVRSRRYGRHLSILMIDIDLFKRVNDTYGHIVGDAVIRGVAASMREHTRRSDFAGRYGGEEFVIMLPETALDHALLLAEKLRVQIESLVIECEGHTLSDTSVSIGVAEYQDGDSATHLIDRSDKGLYAAKENGRNQVAHIA